MTRQVRFLHARALAAEEIAGIAEQVRRRVLRWFARSGLLDGDDARDMLGWDNGGFSLDASVRIAGHGRARLERLLRYCARPPFALERIEQVNGHQVIYRLPKPQRDGRTALSLTPQQLIDHLAALLPPPRAYTAVAITAC
ncbi:MAG: transposase [Chromatiaceae bacterium]